MKIQQRRKRPIALRLVNARHQSTRRIAAELDIPDFDLVMLRWIVRGCHVNSSLRLAFLYLMPSHIEKPPSLSKQTLDRKHPVDLDMIRRATGAAPSRVLYPSIILAPRP